MASDRKKPITRELNDTKKAGALGGAFWGFLFGLIFLVPFLGVAIGVAIGAGGRALMGSLRDVGISDAFIKDVREKISPATRPALPARAIADVYTWSPDTPAQDL